MRQAFTLLELVIVLMIVSVISVVALPTILDRSMSSAEGFENRIKGVMETLFSFSSTPEVCADFRNNAIEVSGNRVPFPEGFRLTTFVFPGKLVSAQLASRYCFSGSTPGVAGFIAKGDSVYYTILVFVPSGETFIMRLDESEMETFKDKVFKGRITEWFSFYSY